MTNIKKIHKKALMSGAMSIICAFCLRADNIIKKIFISGQLRWFWVIPLSTIYNFETLITEGNIQPISIELLMNNRNIINNILQKIMPL